MGKSRQKTDKIKMIIEGYSLYSESHDSKRQRNQKVNIYIKHNHITE